MSRRALAALLTLALAQSASARQLVPREGAAAIPVRSEHIRAVVEDGLARTTLRQTFVNPGERTLEAIFELPLPADAALIDVAMEVDGTRLEGLLAERRRARATYDRIVRSKRDPALVERTGANTYRLSVFPVVPHQPTVVELTWIEHAPLVDGALHYVVPFSTRPLTTTSELFVEVRLRSSFPIERVSASRDDAQVVHGSPQEALVALETTRSPREPDFVVSAVLDPRSGGLDVKTFREATGDGWFLALFTPPRLDQDARLPRDVILVIDTSGSMSAEGKLEQAQRAASWLIENLPAGDRLNVLRFSSDVQSFAPAPVEASPENRARLSGFVRDFRAFGGTALGDALAVAAGSPVVEGRVRTIVLLTDGRPTLGELSNEPLIELGRAAREQGARVFPFGVGRDVDSGLLRGIASAGGGTAELFRPGAEIATRLVRFLARTAAPQLANLELVADGIELYDVLPRPLPDVYLGEQIAISGRYRGSGKATLTLSDTVGDERRGYGANRMFPAEAGGSEHVRQLFARQKLAQLEDQLRLRRGLADDAYFAALDRGAYSTSDEIVQEMIGVSLGHGVQCAYTSFLVLLPEDRRRVDPRDLSTLDEALERARAQVGRALGEAEPEPVLKDAEISDHNEEAYAEGDPDFISDSPFDDKAFNTIIGIGAGSGGAFAGRFAERRDPAIHEDVRVGLLQLASAQRPDGGWDDEEDEVRATALCILAFLGDGQTSRRGDHHAAVTAALRWLRDRQDPATGRFGDRLDSEGLRTHALATTALCEAYLFSRSPLVRGSAQRAVRALVEGSAVAAAELAPWIWSALWTAEQARLSIIDSASQAQARAAAERWLARLDAQERGGRPPDEASWLQATTLRFQLGDPAWNAGPRPASIEPPAADPSAADMALWLLCLEAPYRFGR